MKLAVQPSPVTKPARTPVARRRRFAQLDLPGAETQPDLFRPVIDGAREADRLETLNDCEPSR